jgi:tripartite-type tricarboxylate transporter receptor subunit TctC
VDVTTDIVTSAPHIFKMSIDPLKALAPVIQLSHQPVVLAVGVGTLAEFITLAKQQPGLSFATSGIGTQQHVAAEWFAALAGIRLEHVPYRGGAPALNDLLGGHIKIASLGSTPLIPHYKTGTLRLLAQSTAQRAPTLPDVATYRELGFKDLIIEQWIGVFVPAGTPDIVATRLNSEINRALAGAAVLRGFEQHIFKMSIDPLKALAPVIQLSHQPVVLAVHPALGVGTLAEFITLAKQQPGVRCGSFSGSRSSDPISSSTRRSFMSLASCQSCSVRRRWRGYWMQCRGSSTRQR